MPKRKREDTQEDIIDRIEDRSVRIKASRLKVKIDHGNKSLKSAINLAKGFERQKLSRRQKQAENDPHTLLRLREEVIIVKELDAGVTAKKYLLKQLIKTKRIRESAAFTALYGDDPKVANTDTPASANVLGRLLKSNPVREALPDILKGIRDVLGLADPKSTVGNSASQNAAQKSLTVDARTTQASETFDGLSDLDHQPVVRSVPDRSDAAMHSGAESDSDDEEQYAEYAARLADSSDDESELGSPEDVSDHDGDSLGQALKRPARIKADSMSITDRESDSGLPSPSSLSPPPVSSKPKPLPKAIATTAFLPSLSMGGYYSGSDSDFDDAHDHDRKTASSDQQRKNRRGQRARQQIAEKKYGKNAKHLLKQGAKGGPEQSKERSTGWDSRRGAVDAKSAGRFGKTRANYRSTGPTGANGDVVNPDRLRSRTNGSLRETKATRAADKQSKTTNALHPSWEAAKKAKMQKENASFAGKKITFD